MWEPCAYRYLCGGSRLPCGRSGMCQDRGRLSPLWERRVSVLHPSMLRASNYGRPSNPLGFPYTSYGTGFDMGPRGPVQSVPEILPHELAFGYGGIES